MSDRLNRIKPLAFRRGDGILTYGGGTFADGINGRIWVHRTITSGDPYYVTWPARHINSDYFSTEDAAIEWAQAKHAEYVALFLEEQPPDPVKARLVEALRKALFEIMTMHRHRHPDCAKCTTLDVADELQSALAAAEGESK